MDFYCFQPALQKQKSKGVLKAESIPKKEPWAFEMLIMIEAAGQAYECYIWGTAHISHGQCGETQHLGAVYRRLYF